MSDFLETAKKTDIPLDLEVVKEPNLKQRLNEQKTNNVSSIGKSSSENQTKKMNQLCDRIKAFNKKEQEKRFLDNKKGLKEILKSIEDFNTRLHIEGYREQSNPGPDNKTITTQVPYFRDTTARDRFNQAVQRLMAPDSNTYRDYSSFLMEQWGCCLALIEMYKKEACLLSFAAKIAYFVASPILSTSTFIDKMTQTLGLSDPNNPSTIGSGAKYFFTKMFDTITNLGPVKPKFSCALTLDSENSAELKLTSHDQVLDTDFENLVHGCLEGWATQNGCYYNSEERKFYKDETFTEKLDDENVRNQLLDSESLKNYFSSKFDVTVFTNKSNIVTPPNKIDESSKAPNPFYVPLKPYA